MSFAERDFTSEEIEALEELADLQDSDPVRFKEIANEAFAEAEQQEYADAVLDMIEHSTERREEQDREMLDLMFRAHQASLEVEEDKQE